MSILNKNLLKNKSGFTLIEVIAVTAILALLTTIIFKVVNTVVTTQENSEEIIVSERIAHAVFAKMIRELSGRNQIPIKLPDDKQGRTGFFIANNNQEGSLDRDSIRFTSASAAQSLPNQYPNFGPVEVAYRIARGDKDDNSFYLMREEMPVLPPNDDVRKKSTIVAPIAKNVVALNFRYLDQQGWKDQWENQRLPLAIEITVGIELEPDRIEYFRTAVNIDKKQKQQIGQGVTQ